MADTCVLTSVALFYYFACLPKEPLCLNVMTLLVPSEAQNSVSILRLGDARGADFQSSLARLQSLQQQVRPLPLLQAHRAPGVGSACSGAQTSYSQHLVMLVSPACLVCVSPRVDAEMRLEPPS